jgi:transposase
LSRGTEFCDHHAQEKVRAAFNRPEGRTFMAAWRDRLRFALEVAGLPPDAPTFES